MVINYQLVLSIVIQVCERITIIELSSPLCLRRQKHGRLLPSLSREVEQYRQDNRFLGIGISLRNILSPCRE